MADGLNAAQRKAVKTLSGPLLVLAGAGTGKTRVITFRIAELIRTGTAPDRILAVTFTNKAAREMQARATALLGKKRKAPRRKGQKTPRPEISTFHSLCVRILRRHVDQLGYPKTFPIYDSGDQEMVARGALRDIRVADSQLRPSDLMWYVSSWKSAGVPPERARELADDDRAELAAEAYVRYQSSLRAAGALDFDDLLSCTHELFERFPDVLAAESGRFDHLLIDEYQDTNLLQYRIVRALASGHRNLCVVGDDDQSIYGWRGAEVTHILNFANDWPEATVVRLEDNYRCREPILGLANTLIANNRTRHAKTLRAARRGGPEPRIVRFEDETSEAVAVVRQIRQLLDAEGDERKKPSDFAILFRTNEQPRVFETELRRARVPYVLVGGMSFYDRKEVRDVMSYIKLLAHPEDEVALLRVINTPPRGIGQGSVRTLLERAVAAGTPLWHALPGRGTVPDAVADRIERFKASIEGWRARLSAGESPTEVLRQLIHDVDYGAELKRVHKNPADVEARWGAVEELVNSVAAWEERAQSSDLRGFLEEAALSTRDDLTSDKEEKRPRAVTLMTLHSAKGLEFPHVHMVGMEEGLLPHKRSIADGGVEEERRLCYVGVTRARDTLTLTFAKTRMKWGKPRPTIPSRFLMEMRGDSEKAQRAAEAAIARLADDPTAGPAESAGEPSSPKRATKRAGKRSTEAGPRTASSKKKAAKGRLDNPFRSG